MWGSSVELGPLFCFRPPFRASEVHVLALVSARACGCKCVHLHVQVRALHGTSAWTVASKPLLRVFRGPQGPLRGGARGRRGGGMARPRPQKGGFRRGRKPGCARPQDDGLLPFWQTKQRSAGAPEACPTLSMAPRKRALGQTPGPLNQRISTKCAMSKNSPIFATSKTTHPRHEEVQLGKQILKLCTA